MHKQSGILPFEAVFLLEANRSSVLGIIFIILLEEMEFSSHLGVAGCGFPLSQIEMHLQFEISHHDVRSMYLRYSFISVFLFNLTKMLFIRHICYIVLTSSTQVFYGLIK